MSIRSTASYLDGLRQAWSKLPIAPSDLGKKGKGKGKNGKKEEENYLRKIGGEWAERFHVVHVSPSVIPNYFPTLRVFHYNTTGLDSSEPSPVSPEVLTAMLADLEDEESELEDAEFEIEYEELETSLDDLDFTDARKKKNRRKKKKKKKKPKFVMPRPPSKSSPPGPAYSPQTLSLLGYTQYFANLTYINNDFNSSTAIDPLAQLEHFSFGAQTTWQSGMHSTKHPKHPHPRPRKFEYEVEYDTRNKTDEFGMSNGFFVKDWLSLAARMGKFKASSREASSLDPLDVRGGDDGDDDGDEDEDVKAERMSNKKTWLTFIHRAFVGSKSMDELGDRFGHRD